MESGSAADWFSGVASALAVVVALGGYGFSEWQRRREVRERQQAAAQMIGVRLMNAMNRTADIHRHLWPDDPGAPLAGDDAGQLWRRIQPLAGLQDDPAASLSEAEINLLIAMGATEFMTNVMLVISRYLSLVGSMREYGLRYEAMMELAPAPTEMQGPVAVIHMDREQYMRLMPYANALEMMLQGLRSISTENLKNAEDLARQFHPLMKGYFKTKTFLSLVIPEDKRKGVAPNG